MKRKITCWAMVFLLVLGCQSGMSQVFAAGGQILEVSPTDVSGTSFTITVSAQATEREYDALQFKVKTSSGVKVEAYKPLIKNAGEAKKDNVYGMYNLLKNVNYDGKSDQNIIEITFKSDGKPQAIRLEDVRISYGATGKTSNESEASMFISVNGGKESLLDGTSGGSEKPGDGNTDKDKDKDTSASGGSSGGTSVRDEPTPLATSISTSKFTDVSDGAWYKDAVAYVTGKGFFTGTSETQFSPNVAVTRAMFVTVLGRMAEQSGLTTTGYTSSFSDVPQNTWYSGYVGWAAANGIVTGYDANTFGPDNNITREQIAAMFVRFADYAKVQLDTGKAVSFSDQGQVSSWATDGVGKAASAGLVNGYENGTFQPIKTATRAEVASILKKFHESYMVQ